MGEGGIRILIGLAALLAGAAGATVAGSGAVQDRAAIEKIVHDYIIAHPEILPEAMEVLQQREVAKAISANRSAIETPYPGAFIGNPKGDVTLVEYFDYACGYCRASVADVERLVRDDPGLKVVFREFPVLGPDSEAAARVSLAAAKAGKYGAFHHALYAAGHPDAATVARVAASLGVSPGDAKSANVEAEIAANLDMQRTLNMTGTPTWVVGDRMLAGAVGYDALKAAIAQARAAKR